MKFGNVAGLLGFSSFGSRDPARIFAEVPACSLGCFDQAALTYGCAVGNLECICSKQRQMVVTMERCLRRSCSDELADRTHSLTSEMCGTGPLAPLVNSQKNQKKRQAAGAETVTVTVTESCGASTPTATAAAVHASAAAATHATAAASSIGSSIPSTPKATTVATAGAAAMATPAIMAGVIAIGAMLL